MKKEKDFTTTTSIHRKRLQGTRILLVEDNPANREIVLTVLNQIDVAVEIANNGQEAVDAVCRPETCPFDAVLMNIQLPQMDGFQATISIRRDPRYTSLPIIAVTAHAMKGDEEKCLAAGMNALISKPINQDKLFPTLWGLLKPSTDASLPVGPQTGNTSEDKRREKHVLEIRAANAEETGELPTALPGIAVRKTMDKLGINSGTLKKILLGFLRNHGDIERKLHETYREKDWSALREVAHSLKGSGGNIGADDLEQAARDLEIACKVGKTTSPDRELVEKVASALRQVLQSLQTLEDTKESGAVEREDRHLDMQKLASDFKQLAEAIDSAYPKMIGEYLAAIEDQLGKQMVRELRNQLDSYEYDKAMETLGELAEKNGIH